MKIIVIPIMAILIFMILILSGCGSSSPATAGGGTGGGTGGGGGGSTTLAITSFFPTSGTAGTIITINGSNFSTTAASNTVKFNGVTATIYSVTATSIRAAVPASATTGPITVTTGTQTATSVNNFYLSAAAGGPVTNPVASTARELVKFTVGDQWDYAVNQTTYTSSTAMSPASSSVSNYISTTWITSAVPNSSATYMTSNTAPGSWTISTSNYLDINGNLLADVPIMNTIGMMVFPAQIFVGTTWQQPIALSPASNTLSVTSTNATYTGPAGTFNNLVRVDIACNAITTIMGVPAIVTESGYQLISPAVGSSVYENITTMTTMTFVVGMPVTTTSTTIKVLQPGYIAN